ncbi:hypothetical protein AMIS_36260 [Actinoplanes missouriensis 431]|uniref:Uncharacterized protein n=1 Tax=Actinoplanes missouriensis (strain ATCC 14538 / DSM 43046 / CBS 188.64 / JCM 3121 / NBRC 102363 / NCIMB 12654 / NRRL B-3342 / UNCC 431) TaxID=512565 RepID=I0H759_ACTM4|nr:hypothetical protein [Actinoplanes missouriensis]BAL88846.1 hypothetical protein AMIS_36260 [Actinoplanes missouriensis 431]
MPAGDVAIHDVLADETARYVRRDGVVSGGLDRARDLGLWLSAESGALVVDRLPAGAAYPRHSGPARLFTLKPGETGRYRANFRFTVTTCACNPGWYYEDWLILIANCEMKADGFVSRKPDHHVDHRVHLYGGSLRPSRRHDK